KRAVSVCAAVRVVLVARPTATSSATSSAYCLLVGEYGGSGRYAGGSYVNGRTFPSFTSTGVVGAIGSNTPGPGGAWTYGTTSSKWSPLRQATMPAAAAAPTAFPASFSGPFGTPAMK